MTTLSPQSTLWQLTLLSSSGVLPTTAYFAERHLVQPSLDTIFSKMDYELFVNRFLVLKRLKSPPTTVDDQTSVVGYLHPVPAHTVIHFEEAHL